jgi:uncharacterized protein
MDILSKHANELAAFCKANKIKKLSVFGSYLNDKYTDESDIDLLIEFEQNNSYGMLDVARIERELSEVLGKKVDLRTADELSRYFRDKVVKEAQVKYEGK